MTPRTSEERARQWEQLLQEGRRPLGWDQYGYCWDGPVLYFDVEGDPAGQGALTPIRIKPRGGRERLGNRHSNEKKLTPWRGTVAEAASRAAHRQQWTAVAKTRPVRLDTVFTLPYGPTARKEGRLYPLVGSADNSDLDHYVRAVGDAISSAPTLDKLREEVEVAVVEGLRAVWHDDVQVVEHRSVKTYPGVHPLALPVPGVCVWVHTMVDSPDATR